MDNDDTRMKDEIYTMRRGMRGHNEIEHNDDEFEVKRPHDMHWILKLAQQTHPIKEDGLFQLSNIE